jgi:hypothetical protein
MNIILFCDRVLPQAMDEITDHGLIDWSSWQKGGDPSAT